MTPTDPSVRLRQLGIDPDRPGLVALLPLVRVAWADGRIQDAERDLILRVGGQFGLLDAVGKRVVEDWLSEEPSAFFRTTADRVVRELGAAAFPDGVAPLDVVAWCWALAEAAGGWFGTSVRAVSPEESEALQQIAGALRVDVDQARAALSARPPEPDGAGA